MKNRFSFSTTQIIAFGFVILILIGTLLLMLPISSADGSFTPFVDAFFTATTSSCVTGLVTVTTSEHWSFFGHIVILILIQFGGLGVVTFTTLFLIFTGKRITLKQRMLIQDAYNLDTLKGLIRLTKKIVLGTLIAGFQTIPQENFSHPAQMISMFLMFIGGSPGGTAGGVKTVTTYCGNSRCRFIKDIHNISLRHCCQNN